MSYIFAGGNAICCPSLIFNPASAAPVGNNYVAEDDVTFYVAEDGSTDYVQES